MTDLPNRTWHVFKANPIKIKKPQSKMKRILIIPIFAIAALLQAQADTVAYWDFNSLEPDATASTGTLLPQTGTGACLPIGPTTTYRFQGSTSSDPWVFDNSCLRVAGFPTVANANKTSGVQYMFSTVGYESISLSWENTHNTTASLYWRLQYTADGVNWKDYKVITGQAGVWYFINVDFSGLAATDNNPNFGFRLVSEFESTATGLGENHNYVPISGTTYASAGTLWNDVFTASGSPIDGSNLRPTITPIADQIARIGQSSVVIPFTVGDNETSANDLTVTAESFNPTVITSVDVSGTGANRTATVNIAGTLGSSLIILKVTDGGGKFTESPFNFSVLPANTAPVLSQIPNQQTIEGTPVQMPFTVSDLETSADNLILTVTASDPGFLPAAGNAVITGSGTNKVLTLSPGKAGVATITLTADDGALTASTSFVLRVDRSELVSFWNFNSPVPDADGATGSLLSTNGNGSSEIVGTATYRFQASANTDPATDQSALRVSAFPAVDADNKTAGVQYMFDTTGFKNVAVIWEHNNNSTASKYWRLQYTSDGSTWTDHQVFSGIAGVWYLNSIDFKGLAAANNNPNFGIRLLSEFESTATGSGVDAYVGVSDSYATGGTLWMDMVTITADVADQEAANLAVEISGGNVKVSWPAAVAGALYSTTNLGTPGWAVVEEQPVVDGDRKVVTLAPAGPARFFRLHQ
jgi:hypothetical protein